MLQIEESDVRPLSEFPLKWRWTDSRWNELPGEVLHDIRPLAESKACELARYSSRFYGRIDSFDASPGQAALIDSSSDAVAVRRWLEERRSDPGQRVIVSWDERLAVWVSWGVFCRYWDDFCYPASDDVAVWPLGEEWFLIYDHSEKFFFVTDAA